MLHNKNLKYLWFVNTFTTLAIELFAITVLVTIYEQSESTLQAAGIIVARALPAFLLGPIAGVLVDRFSRKNILILMDLLRMVLVGIAIWFLQGDGSVSVAGIYLIVASLSIADVFHRPARMSLIPSLVSKERLVNANSLLMTSNQIMIAISYTIGGWLILTISLRQIAYGVGILYMLAVLSAMLIVIPKRKKIGDAGEQESFWSSMKSGWVYLRKHPIARSLTVMETIEHLPHGLWTGALLLAFVSIALQGDASDWGYLVTGYFSGMILGSLMSLAFSNWIRRFTGRIIILNAFSVGLLTMAFASSQNVWMVVAWSFIFGVSNAIRDVAQDSLLQDTTAEDQLGRVYTTREMLREAVFMFAGIFFAWLSGFIFIRTIYFIGGILYILTGFYGLSRKALRDSNMET